MSRAFSSMLSQRSRRSEVFSFTGNMILDTLMFEQLAPVREKSTMQSRLLCHLDPASTEGLTIPSR